MRHFRCATIVALSLLFVTLCAAEDPRAQAWTVLNSGLENSNLEKRTRATGDLGLIIGDQRAIDAALKGLNDDKPEVRQAAAQALGEMGAKNAKAQLFAMKDDTDPSVILTAAHSLVLLGDDRGYNFFYAVLTGEMKSGQSLMEQQKKMLSDPKKLAGVGFQAGLGFVPFGGLGLSAFKMFTRDDISPVLAAAALTLAKDPDPKSGQALANAALEQKKWLVREAAYAAIAKRGEPALKDTAIKGLTDEQEMVQYAAAAAVIRLSDIAAAPRTRTSRPPAKPAR